MSIFHYVTPPNGYCPACNRTTGSLTALLEHNLSASKYGERSYRCAVNVAVRTVEARKMTQGSGVRALGGA